MIQWTVKRIDSDGRTTQKASATFKEVGGRLILPGFGTDPELKWTDAADPHAVG